jgi:hypothetical protein
VTHLDPLKPKMPEAVKNRILVPADTRTWRPSTTEPARLDGWRGRRRTSHPHAGREPAFGFRRPGFLTLSRGPRGRDSATTRARPPPPGPRAPHLRRPRPRLGAPDVTPGPRCKETRGVAQPRRRAASPGDFRPPASECHLDPVHPPRCLTSSRVPSFRQRPQPQPASPYLRPETPAGPGARPI